jgi:hypothetical protein
MELEVLNPKGVPKSGFISISVGGTRRQVALSALDKPLRFPGKAEDVSQIKVDVLHVLGSSRLPYKPSVDKYTVPLDVVENPDANIPSHMELDIVVRHCAPESVEPVPTKEEVETRRKNKEAVASDYLQEHDLVSYMQFLLTSLMQDKPEDPYRFLHKQIGKQIASKAGKDQPEQDVYTILDRLSPVSATKMKLGPEEVEQLEREALQAAHKMRSDNASLRETALQLKNEYEQLMKESVNLKSQLNAKREVSKEGFRAPRISEAEVAKETPQAEADPEIQGLQEEIGDLAKENAKLVADLAKGREMIEKLKTAILDIKKQLQS